MADDNTARQRFPLNRSSAPFDTGARAAETDPLTELARLIGQTNPFGEQRAPVAAGRDNEWPATHPAAAVQQAYAQQSLPADYRDDGRYPDPQQPYSPPPSADGYDDHHGAQHYDPQTGYGQSASVAPYYGDNGELLPDDPYAHQDYGYDEPAPKRRSGLITVAAVAGLALLGTGGAYAYRTFFSGGAPVVPPLIKAESGPNKVVPTSQASDAGANKQIYDRVGSGGQAEKIVSREEQPVDVKPANTRPAYVPANAGSGSAVPPVSGQAPNAWPNPPGAAVVSPAPGNQTEPRKVRTVTIRPDGQGVVSPPPATVPSRSGATDLAPPSAPPAARAQQAPAAPARSSGNAPLSLTPQGAERTASADPRAAAVRAPATTASAGSGYVVQLSAQKTEEEASAAFRSAQSRHPGLLGSRQLLLRRKDIPGKGTFYGAQVGPFASREDATQLCESLKSAGSTCLVQKN